MPDRAWFELMARYNRWMNRRLYALCAGLGETKLRRDCGAFFGSIYLTLNHIAYGDLAFLSRFTGEPPAPPRLGADLYGSFARLAAAREAIDQRLLDWTGELTPDWLAGDLSYVSSVDGRRRTLPAWVLAIQVFNHQTHHRGQITTLLSQRGMDIGPTDVTFMPEFPAVSPAEV